MLTARDIARAGGGDASGTTATIPGPGHSKSDRSLSVTVTGPDSFIVYSHAGDDPMACRDYVRSLLGLGAFRPEVGYARAQPAPEPASNSKTEWALKLWAESAPAAGTLVETYLASRAIPLTEKLKEADAIRFHRNCVFYAQLEGTQRKLRYPTMIALFRDVLTGEPKAIHRTALKLDGSGKADDPLLGDPKKMLGPARGCAIRLETISAPVEEMGIAEGIETALSASALFGMPVWAAGSAPGVRNFPAFDGVGRLTVFSDTDAAGYAAAKECARTWRDAGKVWRIARPPADGVDWNDVAKGRA